MVGWIPAKDEYVPNLQPPTRPTPTPGLGVYCEQGQRRKRGARAAKIANPNWAKVFLH